MSETAPLEELFMALSQVRNSNYSWGSYENIRALASSHGHIPTPSLNEACGTLDIDRNQKIDGSQLDMCLTVPDNPDIADRHHSPTRELDNSRADPRLNHGKIKIGGWWECGFAHQQCMPKKAGFEPSRAERGAGMPDGNGKPLDDGAISRARCGAQERRNDRQKRQRYHHVGIDGSLPETGDAVVFDGQSEKGRKLREHSRTGEFSRAYSNIPAGLVCRYQLNSIIGELSAELLIVIKEVIATSANAFEFPPEFGWLGCVTKKSTFSTLVGWTFTIVLVNTVTNVVHGDSLPQITLPWLTAIYSFSASRLVLNIRVVAKRGNTETLAESFTLRSLQFAGVNPGSESVLADSVVNVDDAE
ncbi:hypothetical protein C8R43DRAFT_951418 [Mycena crocata]|nr:hypothetical protein C8R43DRAFT_951418 [Mycena crocata]